MAVDETPHKMGLLQTVPCPITILEHVDLILKTWRYYFLFALYTVVPIGLWRNLIHEREDKIRYLCCCNRNHSLIKSATKIWGQFKVEMIFVFWDEIFLIVYPQDVRCRRPVGCALKGTMFVPSLIFIHVQVPNQLATFDVDHGLLPFHCFSLFSGFQILTLCTHLCN